MSANVQAVIAEPAPEGGRRGITYRIFRTFRIDGFF